MSNDKYPPGTTVFIKVGGKQYKTIIDEHGVQRFEKNTVLDYLETTGKINLNHLSMHYHRNEFTQRDYAEFNMMLGYSVCGFAELSSFEDMEIVNPLWEKE